MNFYFYKMHGSGNEFIIIDDRDNNFPKNNKSLIQHITNRNNGIGSDGLILMQNSLNADVRMLFFNPDGNEVNMCGNGARCISRLANFLNIAERNLLLETNNGIIESCVNDNHVKIKLNINPSSRLNVIIEDKFIVDVLDSGVPHAISWIDNIEDLDFLKIGYKVRWSKYFSPNGINFNAVNVINKNKIKIRTFERGVEDETISCGTGAIAASILACERGLCDFPVHVECRNNNILIVDKINGKITLEGLVVIEFKGEWNCGSWN